MKILKYEQDLIGYAISFVSFILPKITNIQKIILFGSVARREADDKSDIDLFFSLEDVNKEREIKILLEQELNNFYKSKLNEIWSLKGIKNEIKVYIGNLEEWELKRSIISDGIILFGKYEKTPNKLKAYTYFNINPIKNIAKRNKIIRNLFGRKEKDYSAKGIIEEIKGKRLSKSSFITPLENANKIIKLLNQEKINYSFFEFWTDQINL